MSPTALRALTATGVVVLSLAMMVGAQHLAVAPAAEQDTITPEIIDPSDVLEPDSGDATDASEPEPESGALERLPPRPPLSAPVETTDAPKPVLLYRPVASAAGRIEAGGHVVEIEGVRVTEADQTCQTPEGRAWACGMAARTAFRNWLRGRAVLCTVPSEPTSEVVRSACTVGREDAGEWLARSGNSEALAGGPYAETGREAADAHRGIFGVGQPSG